MAVLAAAFLVLPATAVGRDGAFGPGETLVYDLSYGPLKGGSARILVGADTVRDGRTVWPIVVQAHSSDLVSRFVAIQDRIVSFLDPSSATTLGYDFYAIEGGRRHSTRTRFDLRTGAARVVERSGRAPPRERTVQVGVPSHDLTSAIFWLRRRPLKVGDRESLRIFTGVKTWHLQGVVEGRERLSTPSGERSVVRLRLRTFEGGKPVDGRDVLLWFTDDTAHIPVRIHAQLGISSVHAELKGYLPGLMR